MLFAAAASAAERSVLETDPAVTCASAGAISPPARPLAKFSAPIRNSSVMKLNASVNGGTFQAPMNTLASAACRTVEKNAPSAIQTITSAVPVGLQEQRQAGADQDAVEAEQAGADRAAVHAEEQRRGRRDGEAERAREAEPRLPDEHRHQDRQPGDRVVHEADLADAAQAGVDEVEQRIRLRAFRPRRHRPVDRQAGWEPLRGAHRVPSSCRAPSRRHSMTAAESGSRRGQQRCRQRIPGC